VSNFVTITEVGPRDGLQNEKAVISTSDKVAFINDLMEAGLRRIEVGSFVNPELVPAMADAEAIFQLIPRSSEHMHIGLVPNQRGLERAIDAGCQAIALFTASSDGFARANINMSVAESLVQFRDVASKAQAHGMLIRGYVSTVFECPYDGKVDPKRVLEVSQALLDMGCYEVSLGDTTGVGTPAETRQLLDVVLPEIDADNISMHFHDTWGMAVANAITALSSGIRRLDASAGGLGGCPFAKTASGNLATEDLIYALDHLGFDTGVQLEKVASASARLSGYLDHPLPSRVHHALIAQAKADAAC
jgi:hydroxymethylglutaryl-CoA lyase